MTKAQDLIYKLAILITELINQQKVEGIASFFNKYEHTSVRYIAYFILVWSKTHTGHEKLTRLFSDMPRHILVSRNGLRSKSNNWKLQINKS